MIARIWHGVTPSAKADEYKKYIMRTGIPDYKKTPGNRGAWILHRSDGNVTHFLTLSFWDSWDSIRAFAGPEMERAKYYPEDRSFLLELEPTVQHFDMESSPAE